MPGTPPSRTGPRSADRPFRGPGSRPAGKGGPAAGKSGGAAHKPAETPAKSAPEESVPATPPPPREVVSLIDAKKPKDRPPGQRSPAFKPLVPSISRLKTGETRRTPAHPVQEPPKAEVEMPVAASHEPGADTAEEAGIEVAETGEKILHLKPPIIVKELAEHMGLKTFQVIRDLMDLGIFANANQTIQPEEAEKVCGRHGFTFAKEQRVRGGGIHKEEKKVEPPPPVVEKVDELHFRPPIVTFMGHVDHGKTSLLDAIRKARVASGEAGGITQHIGAYSVERKGQKITFLDTPGHAAFTAMRARGANVTDIVVLVVAADDGVMPQTSEAINHAKAANVTILVAVNKIDLPGANPDRVMRQLQELGLAPEEWGGETIFCKVSALKGDGIDHLLDMVLLQSEVLELKANPAGPARATIIEAQMESGRGPTGTVIVKTGTIKVGKPFICGNHWGKVRGLLDDCGKPMKQAGPAVPARIVGFSGLPAAGDELVVMDSEKDARALSDERLEALRAEKLTTPQRATLENLFATMAEDQKKNLRLIVKADVQGSMEAIVGSLRQIETKKIDLDILHAQVGPVSESDILLASSSDAVVIGFNVKVENNAANAARAEGVQIKLYSIIYELIDQVKEAMAGLLEPETRENIIGHAEVKQVFDLTKGRVAGCMVLDGLIARSARARVLRKRQPIYDGGIGTLRRFQDEVKEVRNGLECGIKLGDFNEYQPRDIIECYILDKIPQKL